MNFEVINLRLLFIQVFLIFYIVIEIGSWIRIILNIIIVTVVFDLVICSSTILARV